MPSSQKAISLLRPRSRFVISTSDLWESIITLYSLLKSPQTALLLRQHWKSWRSSHAFRNEAESQVLFLVQNNPSYLFLWVQFKSWQRQKPVPVVSMTLITQTRPLASNSLPKTMWNSCNPDRKGWPLVRTTHSSSVGFSAFCPFLLHSLHVLHIYHVFSLSLQKSEPWREDLKRSAESLCFSPNNGVNKKKTWLKFKIKREDGHRLEDLRLRSDIASHGKARRFHWHCPVVNTRSQGQHLLWAADLLLTLILAFSVWSPKLRYDSSNLLCGTVVTAFLVERQVSSLRGFLHCLYPRLNRT